MLESKARLLRDGALIAALLVFALGLLDVLLLAMDASLGTGLLVKSGLQPQSFAHGAEFFALLSIAFGVIELRKPVSS